MPLLPIVERELRVSARRSRSYWLRLPTAGVAMLLLGGTVCFGKFGLRWTSSELFRLIAWYAFVYCVFAGALTTADCLSAEKRQNTLGLLFLTDLNGYDIALGKLCASSMTCFLGLLAILPVLAIPVLMGGVQYSEFWCVGLSLMSTLFLSLSVGLVISGLSQNPFRATTAAVLLMLLIGFIWPAVCGLLTNLSRWRRFASLALTISPWFTQSTAFASAGPFRSPGFWRSLWIINGLGLVNIGLSCWWLPRGWKDAPDAGGSFSPRHWLECLRQFNLGSGETRRRLRERLLERNAFGWLSGRFRVSAPGLLLVSAGVVCLTAWLALLSSNTSGAPNMEDQLAIWILGGLVLHLFLLGKISSAASERFGEDRQNGALELLLCTPISIGTILRGQWLSLRRQVFGGAAIALLVHGLVLFLAFVVFLPDGLTRERAWHLLLRSLHNVMARAPASPWEEAFGLLCIQAAALVLIAHWITLGWVGMWLALRLRQARFAPWVALGLVLITPWPFFLCAMIGLLEFESSWRESQWFLLCFKLILGLHLANDILLSLWARKNLRLHFRTAAADRYQATTRELWRVRSKWALRWATVGAALGLLLGSFHFEENRRGRRAWNTLLKELASRGERLELASIEPAPVAPRDDFAQAPVWVDLAGGQPSSSVRGVPGSWRRSISLSLNGRPRGYAGWDQANSWAHQKWTDLERWQKEYRALGLVPTNQPPESVSADILIAFSRFDPQIEALRSASRRPFCRYSTSTSSRLSWGTFPAALEPLDNVSELLRFRASAELDQGQVQEAFEDTKLCLYLADTLQQETAFRSQLMRKDLLDAALQPLWEGLAKGCWAPEHLLWFEDRLSKFDLLGELPHLVRVATLSHIQFWTDYRTFRAQRTGLRQVTRLFSPLGWGYLNQVSIYRVYRDHLVPLAEPKARIYPDRIEALGALLESDTSFPRGAGDELHDLLQGFAYCQNALQQARIACALERYRDDLGYYPEMLAELEPAYLVHVPHDLADGQPLRYRRLHQDEYILYSVGWNQQDDGGRSRDEADWVWRYPIGSRPNLP